VCVGKESGKRSVARAGERVSAQVFGFEAAPCGGGSCAPAVLRVAALASVDVAGRSAQGVYAGALVILSNVVVPGGC